MTTWMPHEPYGWPVYSLLLTLSLLLGSLLCLRSWSRRGGEWPILLSALAAGIALLFVGAKTFYLLQFGWSWQIRAWSGPGMSLYGGLFGLLAGWVLARRWKPFSLPVLLDCAVPSLALGLFLTRIGCFLHGCNGGIPSSLPWSVPFPPGTSAYLYQLRSGLIPTGSSCSLPSHPTQLYESLFGALLFPILYLLGRRRLPAGLLFACGIGSYAIFRFLTEPLRADHNGTVIFSWFTFGQAVSLLVLLLALSMAFRVVMKYRESCGTAGPHSRYCKENAHVSGI